MANIKYKIVKSWINLSIDVSARLELSKNLNGVKFSCKLCSLGLLINMIEINKILSNTENKLKKVIEYML